MGGVKQHPPYHHQLEPSIWIVLWMFPSFILGANKRRALVKENPKIESLKNLNTTNEWGWRKLIFNTSYCPHIIHHPSKVVHLRVLFRPLWVTESILTPFPPTHPPTHPPIPSNPPNTNSITIPTTKIGLNWGHSKHRFRAPLGP